MAFYLLTCFLTQSMSRKFCNISIDLLLYSFFKITINRNGKKRQEKAIWNAVWSLKQSRMVLSLPHSCLSCVKRLAGLLLQIFSPKGAVWQRREAYNKSLFIQHRMSKSSFSSGGGKWRTPFSLAKHFLLPGRELCADHISRYSWLFFPSWPQTSSVKCVKDRSLKCDSFYIVNSVWANLQIMEGTRK